MKNSIPDPYLPRTLPGYYFGQMKKAYRAWLLDSVKTGFHKTRTKRFEALKKLMNSGKGKIAIVLANGPSVNILSSSKLYQFKEHGKADMFCVNFFINSAFAIECPPDYWVLSDPYFFNFEFKRVQNAFEMLKM